MKFSYAIATMILVFGGFFIARNQRELTEWKVRKTELNAKATSLGLSMDPSHADPKLRYATHVRENRTAISQKAKNLTADLAELMRDMAAAQESDKGMDDEAFGERAMNLFAALAELDSDEVKYVIGEMDQDTGLPEEMREGIKGLAVMLLSEKNPLAALSIAMNSKAMAKDAEMMKQIISQCLSGLAREDPLAAKKWFDENREKHPESIDNTTLISIVAGAAKQSPVLAFQMLKEVDSDEIGRGAAMLAQTAITHEERTALLRAMRSQLGNFENDEKRKQIEGSFFSSLTASLASGRFESSTAWLDEVDLSQEESALIAGGLQYTNTKNASGEWVGWMAEHLPPEQLAGSVNNLVSEWTRNDYQAVGHWLQQAPNDAAKGPAVAAYAVAVAQYEPEIAEQWALTLPAGDAKNETLSTIREQWPAEDSDGKAAFEARHGLK